MNKILIWKHNFPYIVCPDWLSPINLYVNFSFDKKKENLENFKKSRWPSSPWNKTKISVKVIEKIH